MTSPAVEPIDRRTFLERMAVGLGGAIAAFFGGFGLPFFVSPALQSKPEDWVDVGPVTDVPKGVPAKLEFVERKRDAWVTTERRSSVWVLTADGKDFIAFDPRCTHLGCPYRWDEAKRQFLCPCHTAAFDVDGRVIAGPPPRPLDRFAVKVVAGRLQILPKPTGQAS